MTDVFLITKDNYPVIFQAFEMISHDCGRQAGHVNYAIPLSYQKDIKQIEKDLSLLLLEELEILCIGQDDERDLIVTKVKLEKVDKFLQRFFEEFQ